jgi:hypothetical protein
VVEVLVAEVVVVLVVVVVTGPVMHSVWLQDEISNFICAGGISAKIDKVGPAAYVEHCHIIMPLLGLSARFDKAPSLLVDSPTLGPMPCTPWGLPYRTGSSTAPENPRDPMQSAAYSCVIMTGPGTPEVAA